MEFNKICENFSDKNMASLDKEILHFTLSLYNNSLISRKAVDGIIEMFDNFISNLLIPKIQNQMKNELQSTTTQAVYTRALYILENNKGVFHNYKTEHLRFNEYQRKSFYVPPERYEIGEDEEIEVLDFEKAEVKKTAVYGAHVSLKKTFQKIFTIPGMFRQMQKYLEDLSQDDDFICNIVQGDLWKAKYKSQNKLVFPLFLYFDEFETRNALGSHAGEEKLCGVSIAFVDLYKALLQIFIVEFVLQKIQNVKLWQWKLSISLEQKSLMKRMY